MFRNCKPLAHVIACTTFNNIHRHRERSAARLRTKFEAFVRRKRVEREFVELYEQFIRSLPHSERMMTKRHSTAGGKCAATEGE